MVARQQSRYVDLFRFDQLRPEYLAINPDGVVPTLVHDGHAAHESSIINEYIDDALPGPKLSPLNPLQRARMREFVKICDEGLPAIALPTMVKYLLPKLRKRWGDDELNKRSEQRPTEHYIGMFRRGLAGQVPKQRFKNVLSGLEAFLTAWKRISPARGYGSLGCSRSRTLPWHLMSSDYPRLVRSGFGRRPNAPA